MRRILIMATLFFAVVASPGKAAEPLQDIYACAAVTPDAARLACFDAATARLKSAEQSGDVRVIDKAKVQDLQRESFGFSLPSLPKLIFPHLGSANGDEFKSITAHVQSVMTTRDGRALVVLDNGQTWRQIDDDNSHWVKPGRAIIIKRAALGSFLLVSENGGAAALRVHRDE